MTNREPSEFGSYMVELAVVLPIFFALLFGCYDMSQLVLGFSAVRTAASKGTRMALGYDRPEWQNIGVIFDNNANTQKAAFSELTTPEFTGGGQDATWYSTQAASQGNTFLYRVEARAIAYANRILKKNGVQKYPCQGAGCARCFTLRGSAEYNSIALTSNGATRSKILAIHCEYDVPSTIGSAGIWLPHYITVSSSAYVPIENYSDDWYSPVE